MRESIKVINYINNCQTWLYISDEGNGFFSEKDICLSDILGVIFDENFKKYAIKQETRGKIYLSHRADIKADYKIKISKEYLGSEYELGTGYLAANSLWVYSNSKVQITSVLNNRVKELSNFLRENCISQNKIVIVNGASLEYCGIRMAGDLDIVMDPEERIKISQTKERIQIGNEIEIKPLDSYRVSDVELINCPQYYYAIDGFKCMDVDFILRTKSFSSLLRKAKVRKDVALILNYMAHRKKI